MDLRVDKALNPLLNPIRTRALSEILADALAEQSQGLSQKECYRAWTKQYIQGLQAELAPKSPWLEEVHRLEEHLDLLQNTSRYWAQANELEALLETRKEIGLSYARHQSLEQRQKHWYLAKALPGLKQASKDLWEDEAHKDDQDRSLEDFFGISPGLWDLKPGILNDLKSEVFIEVAEVLKKFPEIRELAQRLGRSSKAEKEESFASVSSLENSQEHSAYRGELKGLRQGRDLEALRPCDWSRLFDPETEDFFLKDLLEGAIFVREYANYSPKPSPKKRPPKSPKPQEKGPCIVCVDSSGSMAGLPEQLARALALALIKICHEENRLLYLILFSDRIHTLSLEPGKKDLAQVLDFLSLSFHGGTDLRPVLEHSLERLSQKAWQDADLVIISDFRVPKILIKRLQIIQTLQKKHNARLHALSVTQEVPQDDLHIFDSLWHFRLDSHGLAQGISPNQFKEMRL